MTYWLLHGVSEEEHLHNLEEVLKRLQQHGVCVKTEKCAFCQDTVEFLGHSIDQRGLHTTSEKVDAILLAPTPKKSARALFISGFGTLLSEVYSQFVHTCTSTE